MELLALAGFAIAQPLLDLFGRAPTQFIFRNAQPLDIVGFGLLVVFAAPTALWAVGAVVGLVSARARTACHLASVAGLVATFVVQAGRPLVSGALLFGLSAVIGTAGAVLSHRARAARVWLRFAAVAPLAFLAIFLFASDTAPLLRDAPEASASVEVGSPAPVVMVVFDEFPLTAIMRSDGTIDEELYPNIAALAADANWYRNATAVSSSTWYAVPAIATGKMPRNGTSPVAQQHPQSLFTLLGGAYDLDVTESVTRLCPADLCAPEAAGAPGRRALLQDAMGVLADRLSYSGKSGDATAGLVEAPAEADGERSGSPPAGEDPWTDFALNQPDRFRTFLDGIDDDQTALHYLHLLLPHVPYRYLPSGARYEPPDPDLGRIEDQWAADPWFATLGRQRMQLQAAYADTLIGELVATLEERGIYDEAAIVLTADHGISFRPGAAIRDIEGQPLDARTVGELAWVPLIVKTPHQEGGTVSDANVLTVDVLPTIADILDVEVPWPVDGRSTLGRPRTGTAKPFHRSDVNAFGVDALPADQIDADVGWRSVTDSAVDRFFRGPPGPARMWQVGPGSDLVGTRVADAEDGLLTAAPMALRDPDRYQLDQRSLTVPALVRGTLSAPTGGSRLAIAVNGVIGAVAPAYDVGDGPEFAVMVDDALFRPGQNEVKVYRVRTGG